MEGNDDGMARRSAWNGTIVYHAHHLVAFSRAYNLLEDYLVGPWHGNYLKDCRTKRESVAIVFSDQFVALRLFSSDPAKLTSETSI